MQIDSEILTESIVRLKLSGRMDVIGTQNIELDLPAIANSVKQKNLSFLVDMSEVSFLASVGIRILYSLAKIINDSEGYIILFNPQPNVLEVIEACGLSSLIPMYLKFQEAIDALNNH